MAGPDSSYSCLEIHICWKVERDARMEPPIQTEYLKTFDVSFIRLLEEINWDFCQAMCDLLMQCTHFLSGGAIVLIFMVEGARVVISFCILSAMPGYIVEPPERTMLA